jgi:hypothetical protein
MGIARSTFYDEPIRAADDTAIVAAMAGICDEFEHYGRLRINCKRPKRKLRFLTHFFGLASRRDLLSRLQVEDGDVERDRVAGALGQAFWRAPLFARPAFSLGIRKSRSPGLPMAVDTEVKSSCSEARLEQIDFPDEFAGCLLRELVGPRDAIECAIFLRTSIARSGLPFRPFRP